MNKVGKNRSLLTNDCLRNRYLDIRGQGSNRSLWELLQSRVDALGGRLSNDISWSVRTLGSACTANGLLTGWSGFSRMRKSKASVTVGRAITNFYRAEHDPLSNTVLIAEGYEILDGRSSVPDAPGFGLKIDEGRFAAQCASKLRPEGLTAHVCMACLAESRVSSHRSIPRPQVWRQLLSVCH